MEEHCMLQWLVEISTKATPDEDKIEAIHRDIEQAMAHVINKIRKIYRSPFSPQIKQARLQRRFYKLHLSMLLNNIDVSSILEGLAQLLDAELPSPSNLDEARQLLQEVQKSVRNHKEGSRTKSDVSRGTSTKSRCS
jgi:hypothetical protein